MGLAMSSEPVEYYDWKVNNCLMEICSLNDRIDNERDSSKRAELYDQCFAVWDEVAKLREKENTPVNMEFSLKSLICSPHKKVTNVGT